MSTQGQKEIAHFFTVYKQLESKKVEVKGWFSREDAVEEIASSCRRHAEASAERH